MVGMNIWGNIMMCFVVIYYLYNNNVSFFGQGEYILRRGGCFIVFYKGLYYVRGLG